MSHTDHICSFVIDTEFDHLPPPVIEKAKECFIDWFGVALLGTRESVVQILIETVLEIGGKGQATILGTGQKTHCLFAALVNGAMSHALDFDDTHEPSLVHPSSPIIPALLSIGEGAKHSGKTLINAFVAGYEVETKLGKAMQPAHIELGWHPTSVLGRIGSAVGSGKLLGLNQEQMRMALGIAATQSSGLRKVFGSMCKPFHPGKAAFDGMLAALLAKKNFTSSPSILEGKGGFLELFSNRQYDQTDWSSTLGAEYEILKNSFKPHAACLLTHPTIDAVKEIRIQHHPKLEEIDAVVCEVSPLAVDAAGKEEPKTGLEGKFSLPFCVAITLTEGKAGEDQFRESKVEDLRIRKLMRKIKVVPQPTLPVTSAIVNVVMANGTSYKKETKYPQGHPNNPLPPGKLEEKYMDITSGILGETKASALLDGLKRLEQVPDINELIPLALAQKK